MALLFVNNIQAQTTDTITMDEILVTAKSSKHIIKSNINGKVLQIENPHDGGAMFKNQVGFSIEKRGNYGMEPVLRGFKYSQLNVQFDGGVHSANACPNRMDPAISQMSPEEVEKIEVIKGPYVVRFGPVFGGIVNVVSKRPSRENGKLVSGSIDAGYQSNGGNYYGNLFTQIVGKKFDFSLNAGYKDFGNYESGDGEEIPSSFTRWGYTLKGGANIKDNQRLQITFRQSQANDVLYAGLPMDGDFDKSSIVSLDYGATNISKTIAHIKIKAYGSFVTHEMSTKRRPSWKLTEAVSPVETQVFGGRTEFGLNTGSKNIIYAGVDYKQIAKQGQRNRLVKINGCTGDTLPQPKEFADKIWQDTKKDDIGFFFENKYQINGSLVWLAAIRADYVSYAINDPAEDFKEYYGGEIQPDSRIAPIITTNLTWYLDNDLNIQWAAAMATRTPDISELFVNHFGIGMDAYEYLGNPNLKSETNYQTDIKVEKHWKNITVFGDIFYSYLNNYITAKLDTTIAKKFMPCMPPKGTKVFTNVEKAFMTGFEAGIDINFLKNFTYSLGAAYTYAQNTTWDEPLSEIPPFTINTYLAYKTNKIDTRLHARIVSEQNRVSPSFNESTTPGFTVMDYYLVYSPWKFLDVNFAITNIFDANYVEHLSRAYKNQGPNTGSLYYEPGRSFNIGARFKF